VASGLDRTKKNHYSSQQILIINTKTCTAYKQYIYVCVHNAQRLRHSYNETRRRSRTGWFGGVRGGGDRGFWNTFRLPKPTYL